MVKDSQTKSPKSRMSSSVKLFLKFLRLTLIYLILAVFKDSIDFVLLTKAITILDLFL